jgi:hypothetical protein
MMRTIKHKTTLFKKESGVTVILLALMIGALLSLFGLVIGVSSIFSGKSRLQNTTNLAAYAAIEAFMRDENPNTLTDRLNRSQQAVNTILKKNSLFFFSGDYNNSRIWNGSYITNTPQLQFGVWLDGLPNNCTNLATSKTEELTGCDCPAFSLEATEGRGNPYAPCFIPYTINEMAIAKTPANAVRALIKTPANAITSPFLNLIGKGVSNKTQFDSEAIAATVERCTVFLVDVSNSSFNMSHQHYAVGPEWMNPVTYDNSNDTFKLDPKFNSGIPGNYAIEAPSTNPLNMYDCTPAALTGLNLSNVLPTNPFIERNWGRADAHLYWCGMSKERPTACLDPNNYTPPCDQHYRSDYDVEDTVDGMLAIDKFRRAQPLESIFIAVNSSLRGLAAKGTAMDKVAILPFSDQIHAPVPPIGLSRKLDFMIDITDMRRAGRKVYDTTTNTWITVDEEHPNFIDRGWSPVEINKFARSSVPKQGTDILGALHEGINRLSDPKFCGQRARKTLVLASDGIMNMLYKRTGNSVDWGSPRLIKNRHDLIEAEEILYSDTSLTDNIQRLLIENDIHLVPMLMGDMVEPNFINVLKPGGSNGSGAQTIDECYANIAGIPGQLDTFYSIPELAARGYRGFPLAYSNPPEYPITDNSNYVPPIPSTVTSHNACDSATGNYSLDLCAIVMSRYLDGVKYRKPNGYMAQLAILSQGLFCPISEPYRNNAGFVDANCYETSCAMYQPYNSDLSSCEETLSRTWKSSSPPNCARMSGTFQTKSTYGDAFGGQAANCIRSALGAPPYYLATDEPY